MDTESRYLICRFILNSGRTGLVLKDLVPDILQEYSSVNSIKVVLVDKYSRSIGWKTGLITSRLNLKESCTQLAIHFMNMNIHLAQFLSMLIELKEALLLILLQVLEGSFAEMISIDRCLDNFYLAAGATEYLSADQRMLLKYAAGISRRNKP